ncbi:MAG: hypothetical protein JF606_29150 [Burkholderiales bacterium]|nr:hypothetical protein [Burkholderiales bacterium]
MFFKRCSAALDDGECGRFVHQRSVALPEVSIHLEDTPVNSVGDIAGTEQPDLIAATRTLHFSQPRGASTPARGGPCHLEM